MRALRMWRSGQLLEDEADDVEALSVTLARLAQSLLLTPDAPPLLDNTPTRMRRYAELVVVPMVPRTTVQTS